MLESVGKLLGDFFGTNNDTNGDDQNSLGRDKRKKEYGSLDDIRNPNMRSNGTARTRYKQRLDRRNKSRVNEGLLQSGLGDQRRSSRNKVRKPHDEVRKGGKLYSMWKGLKTIFSNEEQDLTLLRQACGNVNSMVLQNKKTDGIEDRKRLKERIARSEAFKKKLLEIKYDDKMLEQLRRGRSRFPRLGTRSLKSHERQAYNIEGDQRTLLQRKVEDLEQNVRKITRDLHITQKKLKFAQEKNLLLESLLDDANIDSEYVKSKRDMKNIQKENLKPESELPPSPRRTVNPLFTSSPMRNPATTSNANVNTLETGPTSATDFYNKYPKIPETESLMQNQRSHSLSPIRIDYSKYSV